MIPLLAALDYSVFPPINAALNGLSTVLLVLGVVLIKSGHRRAHQAAMLGALASSAVFLACYLTYHYGVGHTEFPREHPVARRVYLAILLPHILLAVVNLPFIVMLVVAAFRGRFERHKRLAKFTFPSWLFVSVTGVVIYFMLYQWFPATAEEPPAAPEAAASDPSAKTPPAIPQGGGELVFSPTSQTVRAEPGQALVEVLFKVENTAARPLRIASLESGCECLEVSVDANPVPAGGSTLIRGVFDVSKLRGSADRKIAVTPEGRSRPLFLNTNIEIEPVYEIEPSMTTWQKGGDPAKRTVVFRVVRKEPVHVLSAESKRPEVACDLVEVEKGRLYHLELTPVSTETTLLGIVRLRTDCELENYASPLAYFSIQ
jgi:putative membrane protein